MIEKKVKVQFILILIEIYYLVNNLKNIPTFQCVQKYRLKNLILNTNYLISYLL